MFRLINSVVLIGFINLTVLAIFILILDLFLGSVSFYILILAALLSLLLLISLCEYIMLYYFEAKEIRVNDDRYEVVNNFKFKKNKSALLMFRSDNSPLILRVGFFNNSKYLINEKLLQKLNELEVQTILDLELSYSQTFLSFLEQYVQKLYFLFFQFPYEIIRNKTQPEIVDYLVAPMKLVYDYICTSLRMNFYYKGKYAYVLPQLVLKTKLFEVNKLKAAFLGFSTRNIELMKCDFQVEAGDIKKFKTNELFR